MARTPTFDHDTVVRAARTLFWRTGYDDASIPDLEEATGLSRSSLYNTFGSKRSLFVAAIQSYLDEIIRPRLRPLVEAPVAPQALADYLEGLAAAFERIESMPSANGCMLLNAAGGQIVHDEEIAGVIAGYERDLRAAIGNGVAARFPDLPPDDRAGLGDMITGLVISAFALVRANRPQALTMLATARRTLDASRTV